MKISLCIAANFLLLPLLYTQSAPSLKQAEQLLGTKQYEQAIDEISNWLSQGTDFSDKDLSKAYFMRGQAYYEITQQPTLLQQHPEAFFEAYENLKKVNQVDTKGTYQAKVFSAIQNMRSAMLSNALRKVNEANRTDISLDQAKTLATTAEAFLNILIETESNNYLYYDLRGQVQLVNRDSLSAAMDFQNAIRLYKDYPPLQSDFLVAYAYYRTAEIQRLSLDYDQQALQTIKAGLRFLEQEWTKTAQPKTNQQEQYNKAKQDLIRLELDILYSNDAYKDRALERMSEIIEVLPNDYSLRCAYAALLEDDRPNEAVQQYKKAIALAPNRKMAYYNLAALHINQSIQFLQSDDSGDITQREATANQKALLAVPYLEKAHQIDPSDLSIIQQLMTIFLRTRQMDNYQLYKAKYNARM